MLAPAFMPIAPPAAAQGLTHVDYAITSLWIQQPNRPWEQQTFVDGEKALLVTVNVTNKIGSPPPPAAGLPVVVYDHDAIGNTTLTDWRACRMVSLAPGESRSVEFTIRVTRPGTVDDAQHLVKAYANKRWDSRVQFPGASQGCQQSSVQSEASSVPQLSTDSDNEKGRFVIVDHRLNLVPRELRACPGDAAGPNCNANLPLDNPYSRVEYDPWAEGEANENTRRLSFWWIIDNAEDATWTNPKDPNSCEWNTTGCTSAAWTGWTIHYRVAYRSLNGTGLSTDFGVAIDNPESFVKLDAFGQGYDSLDSTQAFYLYRRASDYNFTITLDPRSLYLETKKNDNVAGTEQHVHAPDLRGWINPQGLRTDPADPFTYDAAGFVTIPVNFSVINSGTWEARNFTGEETGDPSANQPIYYRLYLDKIEDALPYLRWNVSTTLAIARNANISGFTGSDIKGKNNDDADRITPGKHTLYLVVDPWWSTTVPFCTPPQTTTCPRVGQAFESNERNNVYAIDVYVEDNNKPVFEHFKLNNVGGNDPDEMKLTLHKSEAARWRINVTEDDEGADIRLFVQLPNGTITNRTMSKIGEDGAKKHYELNLPNGYQQLGVHKAWVNATDSQGNHNKSWEYRLTIEPWEIQKKNESQIMQYEGTPGSGDVPNGTQFSQADSGVTFRIRAAANETGIYPDNTTSNKVIRVDYPQTGAVEETMTSLQSGCSTLPVTGLPVGTCTNADLFGYNVATSEIGKYNVSIRITDKAQDVRYINRTFEVKGPVPQINDWSLQEVVDAGLTVPIRVNVTSAEPVASVHAVFTSVSSSYSWNQTLLLTNGTTNSGNWTANMTTGHLRNLTNGGAYDVRFAAVDIHGTWGTADTNFTLRDSAAPVLVAADVTPNPQEVQVNVTFTARASDNTNHTVKLTIKRGSEVVQVVESCPWKSNQTGCFETKSPTDRVNYTYTRNFTVADDYSFTVEVVDSVTLKATPITKTFAIAENLPPRIEIMQPSFVSSNGERFGNAQPRIQLLVSDRDGILENSITLSIRTLSGSSPPSPWRNVTLLPEMITPNAEPKGFLVTYDVPATSPFTHNTTVQLNASATDLSLKAFTGYLEPARDRFRVDARPPTSGIPDLIGDSYRELDTDVWNVSLGTIIQLNADENQDGARTDVKAIRFNVLRNGQSQDFVYSTTEKITFRDLFRRGVTNLGSGPYKIQYWAIDAVDNQERTAKIFDVYLDDLPPSPDLFATRPQGKYVNASWVDNHAGVSRVATWFKINNGIYQPLEMKLRDGIWQTVIPGGKKGDTICYYLEAWDRVSNSATLPPVNATGNPYSCYPVGNQLPSITLLEPGQGATVRGTTTIRWTASDPDGEPLTFKIFTRLVGRPNFQELTSLPSGTERFAWDTTKLADGTYELQVQVTDGNFVTFEQVRVTVKNSATAIDPDSVSVPATVRPGESVLITALVTKAGAHVEARIFRDGNLVQSVTMNDDGIDGDEVADDNVYSAVVTFQEGGAYDVEIYARYQEDGKIVETSLPNAASFTVRFNPADVFSLYAGLWIAIAALVVACAGVGGYALFRKWKK